MSDKPRILFVDDEPLVLEALQRAYFRHRRHDWDMSFKTEPLNAIALHKETPFHVVVTDFYMPHMNGIELAQRIQETDDTCQVVMLTGAADLGTAAHVINSTRIFRFYTKPCPPEILEQGIEDCLIRHKQKRKENKPANQVGTDALNRLPLGIIICKKDGHVIHMNQFAAEICSAQQVLSIDSANILRTVRACYRDDLACCLRGDDKNDKAISIARDTSDTPICVIGSPLIDSANDKVMLLISDPDKHVAPSIEILQSLYDLPPSEARLLHHIVQGAPLAKAAQNLGITESSARTYLKRIFAKTNTKGQPELIRSVLMTPTLRQQDFTDVSG